MLSVLDSSFDKGCIKKFNLMYDLINNSRLNVTAIKEPRDFAYKHVLDSVYFFMHNNLNISTLADLGSGGGFPGIIIAVCYPTYKITLVESIGKKCSFLAHVVNELKLSNVEIINDRAENIQDKKYDIITARGVAPVKDVLRYTRHMAHNKTSWLMYKGQRLQEEMLHARSDINRRGLKSEIQRIETPFTRSYLYLHP